MDNNLNDLLHKNKLTLLIIDYSNYDQYESWLENLSICDEDIISNSLEQLNYMILDDKHEGYIGYFVTNEHNDVISVIICQNYIEHDDKIPNKYKNIINNPLYFKISLICTNYNKKIKYLTLELLKFIFNNYIQSFGKTKAILFLAKPEINQNALNFYTKFGFNLIDDKGLMIYNNSTGGKKNKKNKSKKYIKTKKSRISRKNKYKKLKKSRLSRKNKYKKSKKTKSTFY